MSLKNKFHLGKIFSIIGPGFITASVCIGPGSISTNSKIGAYYGLHLVWVLVAAVVSMVIFTVMATRFGVVSKKSILQEVSERYGRWLAVWLGISAYFMSAGFEFGNNLGIATAMNTLTGIPENIWPFVFCGIAIYIIFTSSNIYKVLERIMIVLVAVMITAFATNLFFIKPGGTEIFSTLLPGLPDGSITEAAALAGTTFCINASLYQAYLVQDKGWTKKNYKKSINDTIAGIVVLGFISLIIMVTAAFSLHSGINSHDIVITLRTAGDMAVQLEKLFGSLAKYIFCFGLFAASFSSLVVNSFLGGGLLTDSFGWGGSTKNFRTKISATVIMLIGMTIAVFFRGNIVNALVFAQASTIFGFPAFALILMLVLNNKQIMGDYVNKWWENVLASFGIALLFFMMISTYITKIAPYFR
ncbi:MAG TPA: divalent metal cation transporter [bacterium]|nr:divalent metal cation transporter [bacterium]